VSAEGEASGTAANAGDNSQPASGALYAFNGEPWNQVQYMKATNIGANDELGYGLATTTTGDFVIVGAPFEASDETGWDASGADNSAMDAGAAYLFHRAAPFESHYIKAAQTTAGDQFGWACAMSGNASVIAVSMPFEDGSGRGVDKPVDEAATNAGAVYIYY
jgi:hypothetical protein